MVPCCLYPYWRFLENNSVICTHCRTMFNFEEIEVSRRNPDKLLIVLKKIDDLRWNRSVIRKPEN